MKPKWYSHWYSGDLESTDYIWESWNDAATQFFGNAELDITHFGAGSAAFRSGKYLQYKRGRKRLEKALDERVEFRHLSYIEMNGPFENLAAECGFRASLNSNGIEIDARLDCFEEDLCDSFRAVAESFFRQGRLVTFKTPPRISGIPCLPCNLPANYDRDGSQFVREYVNVTVTYFGSSKGSGAG